MRARNAEGQEPGGNAGPLSRRLLLFFTVAALTAYPPLASLLSGGVLGAFRYFAADSFYYLSVADHSVGASFFTFDGTHPTNGFHPLWQLYLERGFALLGPDAVGQIHFAAISSITFVSLGTALFALSLLSLTGRSWLALLGAAPGLFYLLSPSLNPHHFAQWSFANGMESPLSILYFGALCFALFCRDAMDPAGGRWRAAGISLMLALIVLSRLDDVFLLVPFVALAWWMGGSRRDAVQRALLVGALPSLALAIFMGQNLALTGSLLPSSGAAKAQPLFALARNLYATWTTLVPFADFMREGASVWSSEAWRIHQMLVPMVVSALWLGTSPIVWRRGAGAPSSETRRSATISALAGYVILKTGYNFAMVGLWHQGQWYYPLCLMVVNLIGVTAVARHLDARTGPLPKEGTIAGRLGARWPALARVPVATLAALVVVWVSANAYVDMKARGGHMLQSYRFFEERAEATRLLEQDCPGCGLLAFDDGIVAFSMRSVPTLNGIGLVLDGEARRALDEGTLLDLAWQRGHRLLVSVNYAMPRDAYSNSQELARYLRDNPHLAREDLDRWDFEVAFSLPASGVSFVRFEPRPGRDR